MSSAILVFSAVYLFLVNRGIPPGPVGLPFFGYWPFMNNRNCHLKLKEMKKKYGDIFSFRVTGCLYINLGSIRAVREAHLTKSDCFNERISKFSLLSHVFEEGIGFIYGEPWKIIRNFFTKTLKRRLANSIKTHKVDSLYDSIRSTISDLKDKEGQLVNLTEVLIHKCNTNLRLLLFDEFGISYDKIREINELYVPELSFKTPMNSLLCGIIARYFVFPWMPEFYDFMKSHKKIEKLLYQIIDEHKSTYNKEHIRDIIDEYFAERDKRRDESDPSAKYFTDKTLMASLIQFVADGVLSVASFTGMMAKSLIDHPEEQEKLYEEIREVIGETYLSGYRIPKGANTLVNFYCIHKDPELYAEPEKFNPSRFIQVDGKRREELPILFGIGKRACLGENITMTEVFLFLTTIVQHFHLTSAESSNSSYELFLNGKLLIYAQPRHKKD
ncbi:unnamed protein product [Larinioides sclopetarius]|uniref:Cytochrome P450 n=1 Tax=Larinioides sclopetarius TaxID=280406 RepID=A0AAV1ZA36_9ARAC